MPLKYCDNCNAKLSSTTKSGELIFQCPVCYDEYESSPEDTLIAAINVKETSTERYKNIIVNAPYIPSIEKVKRQCPECKESIVSAVRDVEYRQMFICKCQTVFY